MGQPGDYRRLLRFFANIASVSRDWGATVRYADAAGEERVVSVVGVDEVDLDRHYISWVSPLARALMKSGPDTARPRPPGR